jgi:hypothetical protein
MYKEIFFFGFFFFLIVVIKYNHNDNINKTNAKYILKDFSYIFPNEIKIYDNIFRTLIVLYL